MKKQFFLKKFFLHFILLMIPILTMGIYSISHYNETITEASRRNNWNVLHGIDASMSNLYTVANNASLYFEKNPMIVVDLKKMFREDSPSYRARDASQSMTIYLQNLVNNNSFIYATHIYYDNDNGRFLSSDDGLTNTKSYYNCDWIGAAENSDEENWYEIHTLQRYAYSDPIRVLSLYQKLSSPIAAPKYDGVFVVEFDYDKLQAYLQSLALYDEQNISIIDDNNQVLLQNTPKDIETILPKIMDTINGKEELIAFPVQYDGKSYVGSLLTSEGQNQWRYLSLIPRNVLYEESRTLIFIIVSLTFIALFFSLCIAMMFANKEYKNLESILHILDHAGESDYDPPPLPNRSIDTYGYIMQNLVGLFINQKYLRIQISEKKYRTQVLEMQVLQQQINPHFLFNTLHTIYWEAISMTKSPNNCTQMISSLSNIMEYALGNPQEKVTIQQEIDYSGNYIHIQKIRYKERFEVIWEVDDEATIYPTIKMILQPLIENAIYHGIKEKDEAGVIKVKIHFCKDHIRVCIIDSGNGLTKEKLKSIRNSLLDETSPETHIGLENTNRRLVLTYGVGAAVKIQSKYHEGTIVSFQIPIKAEP